MNLMDVMDHKIADEAKKGYVIFRMPAIKEIPKEASAFGRELALNGVLFAPHAKTLFSLRIANEVRAILAATSSTEDSAASGLFKLEAVLFGDGMRPAHCVLGIYSLDKKLHACPLIGHEGEFSGDASNTIVDLLYCCLGLLSSGMARLENVKASQKLNKKRERNGKAPTVDHVVVRVRNASKSSGVNNDRHGVRLHWRRGHVRRLSSGTLTVVRPCLVGKRELGEVIHDAYDCRHMIQVIGDQTTIH